MAVLFTWLSTLLTLNVNAETARFYEAEYIDGIYMNKQNLTSRTIYYQKARFFRKKTTDEFAYCIEPFTAFRSNQDYTPTDIPYNLTPEKVDRISKIAHFGYGYINHTDAKWYAITQLMIWQEADDNGYYYFSDTLNGSKIDLFQEEINEINSLVDSYSKQPSLNDQTYTITENQTLEIVDENNIIGNYQSDKEGITIENNKLIIHDLKEGLYHFELQRTNTVYNRPLIFYESEKAQNLVQTGDIDDIKANITVEVLKTKIELSKIDKDTKTIEASGEASLDNAKYELYDENHIKIEELTIQNNQAIIENIPLGKYYLKEISAGIGYTLDSEEYEINLTKEKPKTNLILENKVIEKKIIIEKKYGEENSLEAEENVSFQIFNSHGEYIKTVETNKEGIIEIILPYGNYSFVQLNSKDGYQKVDSFQIEVNNQEEEKIELKDLKIPVPNTHTERKSLLSYIFLILILIL